MKEGEKVYINGHGDLGMDADLKYLIGESSNLTYVKITKAGLYQVLDNETNNLYSVPKRNIVRINDQ